ncbi:MAG: carboxylesterase/lipase family protein [Acidimicrobiales bacterium]
MRTPGVEIATGRVEGAPSRGVLRFKGIPYAAPPVGDLRFAPPEPVAPWTGVLEATGRPPVAPQPVGAMEAMAGAANLPPQSEADCLTLNVWTESLEGRRPVMVWIHGGGFTSGTGSTPWYDGVRLAQRGVVVVTINYRLGALGFLHLEGIGGERFAGSANAGLLDQALALRWVADNIAAFGGDPDQVTIFGESAGAMSVATHLGLPASAGLFRTAIAQSGAASHVQEAEQGERRAAAVLEALGVTDPAALRDLPVEALVEVTTTVGGRSRIEAGLPFCPTVDGTTLPTRPLDAVMAGSAAGVTLVAGWNAEEMRLFTAMDPRLKEAGVDRLQALVARHLPEGADVAAAMAAYQEAAGPEATAGEVAEAVLTDSVFRIPAIRLLEAQAPHAPATHAYEFRYRSPGFGAAHAVEIPFAFDNLDAPGASFFAGEPTDAMRSLATAMADAWVATATAGSPGHDWPAYDTAERQTRILDLECSVESDPGATTRQHWG